MALVKTSGIISEVSGLLGGVVFARNRGGAYARQFTHPVNPNTAKQIAQRNKLTACSTKWKMLTDAQRQSWVDAANTAFRSVVNRLGEQTYLTGFQLFIKQNLIGATVGSSFLETAPLPMPAVDVAIAPGAVFEPNSTTALMMQVSSVDGSNLLANANERVVLRLSMPFTTGASAARNVILGVFSSASPEVLDAGTPVLDFQIPQSMVDGAIGRAPVGSKVEISVEPVYTDDPWTYISTKETIGAS